MSPIRLLIIAILIYIGYRLIKGSGGRKKVDDAADTQASVSDVLVEDPVCKKLVPREQAVHLQHEGKDIYFCSKQCCSSFVSQKGEQQ